ncbi:uncharacterized protein PG986_011425 [Apiospora aurea]|uniref:Uncharacterized protein n=1 Tax=Apiospora aurea TaxID=335848 RepID=A0ABR1Q514_9PEZI
MAQIKTYLLAPNFTYKPSGPIQLGSIITNPLRPAKVLSTLDHASAEPAAETVIEHDHELSQGRGRSVRAGLWAQFLQTVSAEYQIDRLGTRYLRVRREKRRAVGGGVSADVPVVPDGVLAGVGGEFGAERRDEQTSSFRGGGEDVIFVYELSVVQLRGRKDRETVEVDILEHAAAFLHEEDTPKGKEEDTEITVGEADVECIMESGVEVKATKVQDEKGDIVICVAVP